MGFLTIMVTKDRQSDIVAALKYFCGRILEYKKIGIAYVTTAKPLDDKTREEVVEKLLKIRGNLILVAPILYLLFHLLKHLNNFNVGTAVAGAFQRTDCSCNNGVGIGERGGNNMGREGGVITAAMLHMKYESNIKKLGFQWCIRTVGAKNM